MARCAADSSTNANYTAGENSQLMLTPELRAAAGMMLGENADALLRAVSLTMQKYDTDMKTPGGRRGWHGRLIRDEVSTNGLCKVEVYSNEVTGAVWRYRTPFKPVAVKPTKRKVTYTTNGVPVALARARARLAAQAEAGTVTTNVVVRAREAGVVSATGTTTNVVMDVR